MLADFADYQRRLHRASLKAADIAGPPTAAARPAEDLFSDQG